MSARGVLAVARMELEQSVLRPLSLALTGFFLLIVVGAAYGGSQVVESVAGQLLPPQLLTGVLLALMAIAIAFFSPIVPIVSSVLTVVEERSQRTFDFVLSRPVTRRGVAAGKILGRSLHVVALALVGISVGLLLAAPKVPLSAGSVAVFVLLVALLCVAWVSIAVLLSCVVRTPTIALVAAFGAYFTFLLLWGFVGFGLGRAGLGGLAPLTNPNTLFLGAVQALIPMPGGGGQGFGQQALQALTAGLNVDYALPVLLLFTASVTFAAVEVFRRQDEGGG